MSNEITGPNDSSVLLLMLQNQQLAERETEAQRDTAHALGVAFLKIGNVYRGLQESQKKFEDTIQWVNAGMSAVSMGTSVAGVASAANAPQQPAQARAQAQQGQQNQEANEKKDLHPPAGQPNAYDYAKEAFKVGEEWSKAMLGADDKADKMNEDTAKSASKEAFNAKDRAEKDYRGERALTKQLAETARSGRKKDFAG